jgi:hypothetical protein
MVQAFPSSHTAPFVFAGFEHDPLLGSQVPALWHESDAVHETGLAPVHVPPWQVSLWVHAFASLHAAPLVFAGLEHVPLAGSQDPASWH